MIALPNAKSHGSNAGGGGALTAFTAMSAAIADPDTIASAVANKTTFFIVFPIYFQKARPVFIAPGRRHPNATRFAQLRPNLVRVHESVKQKKQTTADFLGVLAFL